MFTGWIRNTNWTSEGKGYTASNCRLDSGWQTPPKSVSLRIQTLAHTHTLHRHPRPPDVIEKMNQFLWRLSVVFVTKRWKTITLSVLLLLTSWLTLFRPPFSWMCFIGGASNFCEHSLFIVVDVDECWKECWAAAAPPLVAWCSWKIDILPCAKILLLSFSTTRLIEVSFRPKTNLIHFYWKNISFCASLVFFSLEFFTSKQLSSILADITTYNFFFFFLLSYSLTSLCALDSWGGLKMIIQLFMIINSEQSSCRALLYTREKRIIMLFY